MIKQKINIKRYNWVVYCYFAVDTYYIDEIAERLVQIGCTNDFLRRAIGNMKDGTLNNGFCYSNTQNGQTVLVTSLTSSAEEFINSFTHELHHLVCHVTGAYGISPVGEEAAYLMGDMARETYQSIKPLLDETDRTLL